MVNNFVKSGIGGTIASLVYYILAYELDKTYDSKEATLISYSISAIFNFTIQYNIFLKSSLMRTHIFKYALVFILGIIINQILTDYLLDNKQKFHKYVPKILKEYYNTLARIIVGLIIFICLLYPARVYWIFK